MIWKQGVPTEELDILRHWCKIVQRNWEKLWGLSWVTIFGKHAFLKTVWKLAREVIQWALIHGYKSRAPTYDVHEEWHWAINTVKLGSTQLGNATQNNHTFDLHCRFDSCLKTYSANGSPCLLYQQGTTPSPSPVCVNKCQALLLMFYTKGQGHPEKVNAFLS